MRRWRVDRGITLHGRDGARITSRTQLPAAPPLAIRAWARQVGRGARAVAGRPVAAGLSVGSLPQHEAQMGVPRRRHPTPRSRRPSPDPLRAAVPRRPPSLHTVQPPAPQHTRRLGHVHKHLLAMFHHLRSGLQHRLLHTPPIPAAAGRIFQLAAQHPGQVERQQLQQQTGLIGFERSGRQAITDRPVELAQPSLERPAPAIALQHLPTATLCDRPVGHQEGKKRCQDEFP